MRRLLGLLAVLSVAPAAAATVIELTRSPVVGVEQTVRLVGVGQALPGVPIRATYHPRSEVTVVERLGTTDADGSLRWRPRAAGLVRLTAPIGEPPVAVHRDVAVRFRRTPGSGLATLLLAAAVLASGLAAGLRRASSLGSSG